MAAAKEHFSALTKSFEPRAHYPLAYYLAGLTIECLFRAFSELTGGEHDSKHDLRRLAENGQFFQQLPQDQQENARAALGEVITRWRNNHRYKSITSLRRFLNEEGLYSVSGKQTIKGDVASHNWLVLEEATDTLLKLGIGRWEISKKKWRG